MQKTIFSKHGTVISQRLVELRHNAGLTQRELAKKLKKVHSFIGNYELGERRIDIAEFYWICKACNADPKKEASKLMDAFDEI